MSGLDLSAAFEAAARAVRDANGNNVATVLSVGITAAAPLIEAQVREQVAADIEKVSRVSTEAAAGTEGMAAAVFRGNARVFEAAARIARGQQ